MQKVLQLKHFFFSSRFVISASLGVIALGIGLGIGSPAQAAAERPALYRLYNARTGDHFFTANPAERTAALTGGYISEPSPGFLAGADDTNKTALYRLFSPRTGEHFYTTNSAERSALAVSGWVAEGVTGEVSLGAGSTLKPFHRLYLNKSSRLHFYTTNTAELAALQSRGESYEGTSGALYTQAMDTASPSPEPARPISPAPSPISTPDNGNDGPTTPPPVDGNPLTANQLYVDANTPAAQQAAAWRQTRPQDAAAMDKIANQPVATWVGGWSGNITQHVASMLAGIPANRTPVFVAYNIPGRDCGQYSSGGSASADAYKQWVDGLAAGLGQRNAAVILEPDALSQLDCLAVPERASRLELLRYAVNKLGASGHTAVYLDAGHSNWHSAGETANRLNQAGIAQARGFSLNVSNYNQTTSETVFGTAVSALTGLKPFVIDTSRNGNGSNGEWCNPSGRALGIRPTTNTGNPLIDAYLWVKVPGESDGSCNGGPGAGQWWSDYALGLAQRAAY